MAVYRPYIDRAHADEMAVLLGLVRASIAPEAVGRLSALIDAGAVDWPFVLRLAEKHRVWPHFYNNLKKTGLRAAVPDDVQKELFYRYAIVVGNSLRVCRKLTDILTLFESRGIPAVPFKGPLLAYLLYEDEALRCYQDLDILVPESLVVPAGEALREAGFSPAVRGLSGKRFGQVLKYGRECHFLDPSGSLEIDLHWRLGSPFRRPFDYTFCRDRLQAVSWHGRDMAGLSAEDTLLHLCVNGAHDMWTDLEQVLTIADLIGRYPRLDWALVQALASDLGCQRMLHLGLFLAQDVFEAALPREIDSRIKSDRVVEELARVVYIRLFQGVHRRTYFETRVEQLPCQLKMREHARDKLSYLLRRIFIPTQKDWENRGAESRPMNFYFISRPINLAVELLRALRRR